MFFKTLLVKGRFIFHAYLHIDSYGKEKKCYKVWHQQISLNATSRISVCLMLVHFQAYWYIFTSMPVESNNKKKGKLRLIRKKLHHSDKNCSQEMLKRFLHYD